MGNVDLISRHRDKRKGKKKRERERERERKTLFITRFGKNLLERREE